jgi:hypothetical protein
MYRPIRRTATPLVVAAVDTLATAPANAGDEEISVVASRQAYRRATQTWTGR